MHVRLQIGRLIDWLIGCLSLLYQPNKAAEVQVGVYRTPTLSLCQHLTGRP